MSAPRTARAIARAELTRAILDLAGEQLAEVGPAALSVRRIARDLEMASSAVYRYFPSRDALLTALIVEGYDDLGARAEAADAAVERSRHDLRWRAIAHAVRDWAREQPHRYALLYGSPVPGYAAPQDTVTPATRITALLLAVVRDAEQAGVRPRGALPVPAAERAAVQPVATMLTPHLGEEMTVRGLGAWATLFGHVSLELFGHMHRGVLDYDAHFAHVVDQLAADLGLG
ncbi:TetR/AcrR family transcriptional regulator [Nocardioides sp.]|uniref:TetR/AcrR family transcriptional regulator n=1 Tax=Nocardioides sp. TaxID=35761 RepID=UPI0037844A3E